jgi:CelD/BcsL family acetyltransferase involved in cellulose biosynthesis
MGAVVDPACAETVYKSLNNCMRESVALRELEALHFEGTAHNDAWIPQLAGFADEAGYSIRNQAMVNSWSLPLPSSWSALQQSQRGRSVYRKAKKCFGKIESGDLTIRQLTHASALNEGMAHLIRLHQARRESVGDQGCFSDPRFRLFLEDAIGNMLAAGTACFTTCESEGVVIGIALLLLGSDTVFMYQSGVDPKYMALEPGHSTLTGSLSLAIAKGYRNYDFLRGDETYKVYWGAQPKPLQRIILAPPTLKAQTIEVVYRNLGWLKSCYSDLSATISKKS